LLRIFTTVDDNKTNAGNPGREKKMEKNQMTRKELSALGYTLIRTGSRRGYVSVKITADDRPAEPYSGRFGNGYIVVLPFPGSSQYVRVEYWVKYK
jgi:hypothetical protein